MQARSLLAVKAALAPWCQVPNLLVDVENRQKGNCPVQEACPQPLGFCPFTWWPQREEDCND